MLNLPNEFKTKYEKLLGTKKAQELFAAMNEESKKAFRINTLKPTKVSYELTDSVPQINSAYYGEVSGEDPEWVSGSVYSQDPAAMFPAAISGVRPGERVLDLCAAPGGKTTALGEQLKGEGLLVANEISATRVKALRENIERWGISNALITNESPEKLVPIFSEFFDVILVDAPCSGEGMFRKNPEAIGYWSQDYVLTCQNRQKEILNEAVKMLQPGGRLIYSTCTFAPEEDEQIVSWLNKEYGFTILDTGIQANKIDVGQPEWADGNPDLVGLSSVIGAFFAGIAVGQTKVKEKVFLNVEAIGYAIFIPVFFVNIGLEVELASIIKQFPFITLFVLIAVISKLFGGYLGSKMAGFSNNSAWMVGAGMISRGEMALIVLQIGQTGGLIPEKYFAPMVITILISTLVSPLILKFFAKKVLKHA